MCSKLMPTTRQVRISRPPRLQPDLPLRPSAGSDQTRQGDFVMACLIPAIHVIVAQGHSFFDLASTQAGTGTRPAQSSGAIGALVAIVPPAQPWRRRAT